MDDSKVKVLKLIHVITGAITMIILFELSSTNSEFIILIPIIFMFTLLTLASTEILIKEKG